MTAVTAAEAAGCYILRPYAMEVWEEGIRDWFGARIKAMGVKKCYFPLFITKGALEREANHVEGFAAEARPPSRNNTCRAHCPAPRLCRDHAYLVLADCALQSCRALLRLVMRKMRHRARRITAAGAAALLWSR